MAEAQTSFMNQLAWFPSPGCFRAGVAVVMMVLMAMNAFAERNNWKLTDFAPLTSLPWKKEGATMEGVMDAIYRETNQAIRYSVLAMYLRQLPVGELEKAFDLCLKLEGTEVPEDLVGFFLPIWAERDPLVCWQRTRRLFHVVGVEDGWLNYDSWSGRDRITVQDLAAIRASPFRLRGPCLANFPLGVDKSALPREERVHILREFADTWFTAFGTWPGRPTPASDWGQVEVADRLASAFGDPVERLRDYTPTNVSYDELGFEIGMRRWLEADPAAGPKIALLICAGRWPAKEGGWRQTPPSLSKECCMIWARVDLPGMIRWAESLDPRVDAVILQDVRPFLMSRVSAGTRQRWLREEMTSDGHPADLWQGWAEWDPQPALAAAVATKDIETIQTLPEFAAYGPFGGHLYNTCHSGLGVFKEFDISALPPALHDRVMAEYGITVMEQWGDIDIGEAARYGLDFMLRNRYTPRANLIQLFSGDDQFASDSDMIDRTFCALRTWAVVRPQEMEKWIGTVKDGEMRKALTWLLNNPWGPEPKK